MLRNEPGTAPRLRRIRLLLPVRRSFPLSLCSQLCRFRARNPTEWGSPQRGDAVHGRSRAERTQTPTPVVERPERSCQREQPFRLHPMTLRPPRLFGGGSQPRSTHVQSDQVHLPTSMAAPDPSDSAGLVLPSSDPRRRGSLYARLGRSAGRCTGACPGRTEADRLVSSRYGDGRLCRWHGHQSARRRGGRGRRDDGSGGSEVSLTGRARIADRGDALRQRSQRVAYRVTPLYPINLAFTQGTHTP
jgi:hypothetical protein